VRIFKCSFCGGDIMPGFGLMFIRTDGTVQRFCSRRCFVNSVKYRRDPRKLTWIREMRKIEGKQRR
jgi:large subunit ribosomal protein L24e